MLGELRKENGADENVMISPASLSLALTMTYNGASGSTKDAMAKTLGYTGMSLDAVNAGNKALLANLEAPGEGIEISVANSLWARRGVEFKSDFLQRNRDYFGAKVTALDFGDPGAKDTINAWVKDKTRGEIDRTIDRIDRDSVLFLVNAICFKGRWSEPFPSRDTRDGKFTTGRGEIRTVPMMSQSGEYDYLEGDGFQLISLPYGRGRMSMCILLPAKGKGLAAFEPRLTAQNWKKWIDMMHDRMRPVDVSLPKFRIDYSAEAADALSALGMGVAFDRSKADFAAMYPASVGPLYIQRVVHKTYIDVNEQGTEASAATDAEMKTVGVAINSQRMVVDHPFFFAIRDDLTGEILFLGAVEDPASR